MATYSRKSYDKMSLSFHSAMELLAKREKSTLLLRSVTQTSQISRTGKEEAIRITMKMVDHDCHGEISRFTNNYLSGYLPYGHKRDTYFTH